MRISIIRIQHIELCVALFLAMICTVSPTVLQAQGARRSAQTPQTPAAAVSAKSLAGSYADPESPGGVFLALKSEGTFIDGTPDGPL